MPFDWAARYRDEDTPWDLGAPHPELVARLAQGSLAAPPGGARALVPGCGRGHDALALARAGWRVVALDLVPDLAASVAPALARLGGRFERADALAYSEPDPFDLVLDHTFFCALDPADRPAFGALVGRVLGPAGRLASIVFPGDKPADAGGPPFGMSAAALAQALGPAFEPLDTPPLAQRVARRSWAESFALFGRVRPVSA